MKKISLILFVFVLAFTFGCTVEEVKDENSTSPDGIASDVNQDDKTYGEGGTKGKQPHMSNAMKHLRKARMAYPKKKIKQLKLARKQLKKAPRNKGGHRAKAIKNINQAIAQVKTTNNDNGFINQAITQVKLGIQFANRKK